MAMRLVACVYYAAAVLFLVYAALTARAHFTVYERTLPYLWLAGALIVLSALHVGIGQGLVRGWGLRLAALGFPALFGAAGAGALIVDGLEGSLPFTIPPAFAVVLGWWRFLWPARA